MGLLCLQRAGCISEHASTHVSLDHIVVVCTCVPETAETQIAGTVISGSCRDQRGTVGI